MQKTKQIKVINERIINDLRQQKDLKQKVINTIIEVEVLRMKNRYKCDGTDTKYRCEQARLFNIISDESGRGFIDELIRKEVMKLVQIYHSASPKLLHMITTEELVLEYFFE